MNNLETNHSNLDRAKLSPKLSIITVTYNSAETLEQTIQSVIYQQYPNLEYIIVDGGSTDKTITIIQNYQFCITKWISEKDNGLYEAMNKGIKMASGEIIGIINSDDFYLEGAFNKIISATVKHPDSDVFYGNIVYDLPDYPLLISRSKHPLKKSDFCSMPIMHPTVFVRQDCYQKYGAFDLNYQLSADHELMLRLLKAKVRFYYLNENIAQMRAGGVSTQDLHGMREIRAILSKHNASFYTFFRFALSFSRVTTVRLISKWQVIRVLLRIYRTLKSMLQKNFA